MRFIVSIILVLTILVGCGSSTSTYRADDNVAAAEQVINDYFKWYNLKEKEQLVKLLSEDRTGPNVVWGFENLDYIKLVSVQEETDSKVKQLYITNGRGQKYKDENIKVFKVVYEIKYIDDKKAAQPSGTIKWWYFLVRKDQTSPWLIDDWGV